MSSGRWIAAARVVSTLFFSATVVYGFVTASEFAYHQFVRPALLPWLVWGVTFYPALFLGNYSLTLLSLLPDVSSPSRAVRAAALSYIAVWGAAALGLFVWPVMGWLGINTLSIAVAIAAAIPPLWLACLDHGACRMSAFQPGVREPQERRIFVSAVSASGFVWVIYTGLALLLAQGDLSPAAWLLGSSLSLIMHATAFVAMAWLLVASTNLAAATDSPMAEPVLASSILGAWIFFMVQGQLLPALAVRGVASTLAAAGLAAAIAASWYGVSLRLATSGRERLAGLNVFFRPGVPSRSTPLLVGWVAVLPVVAYAGLVLSARMDWAFVVQKFTVLAVWLLAWAAIFPLVRSTRSLSWRWAVAGSLLLLLAYQGARAIGREAPRGSARMQQVTRLTDRYVTYDASFKLLADAVSDRPDTSPDYYQYLIANTNIDRKIAIAPVSIDFVREWNVPGASRPHIFLFVIDSLRRDYVSPYNPAVTFAPRIAAFAAESVVIENAFSRYGGTGLAVPSILSGSLLPHRQYVEPFDPMNALGKLLDHEGYRVMMGMDSVISHLMPRRPDRVELVGPTWAPRGDFCAALTDLTTRLDSTARGVEEAPVFAYALPQNLHILDVLGEPYTGPDWPGFFSPVAARIQRIDICFGSFIDYLKSTGLFDQSVVILTSDHGDSLGEGGRWGHAYAWFPEILRIPLIVHLPSARSWQGDVDRTRLAFSTDITPTLYSVLGQRPVLEGRMFGRSLVETEGGSEPRSRGSYVMASSYAATYCLLSEDGRRLYVVDTVNSRDYEFDLTEGAAGALMAVTPAERALKQQMIAEQIAEIAAFFGFDAQP